MHIHTPKQGGEERLVDTSHTHAYIHLICMHIYIWYEDINVKQITCICI